MSGIVLELQKEALSKDVDIESLLRKAYLIAKKLKLKEFEEWIRQKQEGYGDKKELPQYRYISGELKAYNPALGQWIPMVFSNADKFDFSTLPLSEPIASLNNTYKTNAGSVTFGISSQMTAVFNKYSPFDTIYLFVVSKSQIYQILSTIQNKILEWSLILEENGIIGEEFSFTENEIEKAKQTPVINNYTNNFYANVDNMDLQQGSSE